MAEDRFVLEVPARPAYVVSARIFAASIARASGAEEEAVDDLKLAVSEACGTAVRDDEQGTISVSAVPEGASIGFEVTGGDQIGAAPAGESTPESFSRSVALDVIRSLFPDATVEPGEPTRIRFSFPASA